MENLTDYYYTYHFGYYPFDTRNEYITTDNTIKHLLDNNINGKEIYKIIKDVNAKNALAIEDLPDTLWDNSLLKKDIFYYHRELHITSNAPIYDIKNNKMISNKFFLEMKIQYTLNDLLNYYYKKIQTPIEFTNTKRDIGAFEYLLNKYEQITFIEPIDFVLSLIDCASNSNKMISSILDLQKYENETYEYLKKKITIAKAKKYDKIHWRQQHE